MADIIQLLPESIANQIAAGEVIQRPASVVKELLENAIDAESDDIQVILKNSGKTLIRVVDNGKGMSATDARMCFERHATSKIKKANDLFHISTMGFRGEAMPSIASISHVHLITKQASEDLASEIHIHGSDVKKQGFCQAANGTSISVKNIFYNVPARRKFLKTDAVELRHILDEFKHIALAHPEKKFSLIHNENEIYHLPKGNLKTRVINILGKSVIEGLVPIQEETDVVNIQGFIGKPGIAKKQRGQQFLFVNQRFIKSNYINHAIKMGFDRLISEDVHPFYTLFLEIDPEKIDINVHPTKQEIKFEDEKLIYNYVRVSVKHSLSKHNISPTLDFEKDLSFDQMNAENRSREFNSTNFNSSNPNKPNQQEVNQWSSFYSEMNQMESPTIQSSMSQQTESGQATFPEINETRQQGKDPYQIHNKFIISQIKSGFLLVNQQYARERILYEHFMKVYHGNSSVQAQLFPIHINLNPQQFEILKSMASDLNKLGLKLEEFGNNSFVIQGVPSELADINVHHLVEEILNQFDSGFDINLGAKEKLCQTMSKSGSRLHKKELSTEEMRYLIDDLFACEQPSITSDGKKCFITYELKDLQREFIK